MSAHTDWRTRYQPDTLVEASVSGRLCFGKVLYIYNNLIVADWYTSPKRQGLVWQEGIKAETVSVSK